MICPSCGHENIEGVDRCDECMSSLMKLDVPHPEISEGLARSVMEDDLRKLEPEDCVNVGPDDAVSDVVRRMREARTGCALVLDDGRLVGIFTEHDILTRLTGASAVAGSTLIRGLMSPNPDTLREADSVAAALNRMSLGRYRHIPVVKGDGSYATTSIKGVLKYIAKESW